MEIWRDVVAEEREERGNGECFVAVGYDLEIDRMPVVPEGEERGRGINWYHEQDSYDMSLLIRLGIMDRMHPY